MPINSQEQAMVAIDSTLKEGTPFDRITAPELNKLFKDTFTFLASISTSALVGTAFPSTNPGPATGKRMWVTSTVGTYINFAGIVINAGEAAFIVDTGTTFTKVLLPITLSNYVSIANIIDNLSSQEEDKVLSAKQGAILGSIIQNTILVDVVNGGGSTVSATMAHARAMWFIGKSIKSFNVVSIPIVRDFINGSVFTGSIIVKVWKNNTLMYTHTIALTELVTYNSLTNSNVAADFDYTFVLPKYISIIPNDIICVGWEPTVSADKVGYAIVTEATDTVNEYGGNYVMGSNTVGYITTPTLIPNIPPASQSYRYRVILKKYDLNLPSLQTDVSAVTYVSPTGYKSNYVMESDVLGWSSTKISIKAYAIGVMGITKKTFNSVAFPLVKNYLSSLNFTGDIRAKVWLNRTLIKDVTIPFATVAAYNSLLATDSVYKFDYTMMLDKTYVLTVGDILTLGVTCINTADFFNPFYYTALADPTTEIGENLRVTSTDPNFIINAITPPTLVNTGYRFRVSLLMSQSIFTKRTPEFAFPARIYSVANNILSDKTGNINTEIGLTRNYAGSIYLDHCIRTLPRELDIKFKRSKSDRIDFIAPIDHNGTALVFNGGSSVLQTPTDFTVNGDDVNDTHRTITHISTLASVGKSVLPKILCIGDSLTFGQGAWNTDSSNIINYSLLVKKLFEMDSIDNNDIAGQYKGLLLGHQTRSLTMSYGSVTRTIVGGNEGISGATTNFFLTNNATPFWDTATSSFKIGAWLAKYRTMANDGTRLTNNDSSKGTLVTDTSLYDVTLPTHIILFLGANDSSGSYHTDINTMITSIKAEYTANAWGTVNIAVCLPDTAFTFFPAKYYDRFGERVSFWAETLPTADNRHDKLFTFAKQWSELTPFDQEGQKLWFLPTYWTMPTAESAQVRRLQLSDNNGDPIISSEFQVYGASPRTHVNPNAHFAWAYQIYSWIKYTLSL